MRPAAIFGMVVAVVVSAWTFLAAQSVPERKREEPRAAPFASQAPPLVAANAGSSGPLTPLQQRFLELSAKKAHLMTEEQLQQALNNLDREVEELNAWSKVEESARLLREVVGKHPQTKAATAAKSALGIIDQNRTPNPNSSDPSPFGRGPFSPNSDDTPKYDTPKSEPPLRATPPKV